MGREAETGFLEGSSGGGWLMSDFNIFFGYLKGNTLQVGLQIKELHYSYRILENKVLSE